MAGHASNSTLETSNDHAGDADTERRNLPQRIQQPGKYVCARPERQAGDREERHMPERLGLARRLLRRNDGQPEGRRSQERHLPQRVFGAGQLLRRDEIALHEADRQAFSRTFQAGCALCT